MSHARSFDLAPIHAFAQFRHISKKTVMIISIAILAAGDSGEFVQIQLSLERWKFRLTEIMWQYFVDEFCHLVNDEATAVGLPRDNVIKSLQLCVVQHVVKLGRKGLPRR